MILSKMAMMFMILLITGAQFGCSGQLYIVTGQLLKTKGRMVGSERGYCISSQILSREVSPSSYIVDGKILRNADAVHDDQKCVPGIKQNIVTGPDYAAPYQLVYGPDYLESREFGVTLKEGMVTAVNIKGSPDRGETAKNVLSPIAELASSAIGFSAPEEVLCNANPALKKIVPHSSK